MRTFLDWTEATIISAIKVLTESMIRATLEEHEHMRFLGHYVPELTEQGKESIRNVATVVFNGCSFIIGGKYTAGLRGVRAIRAIRLAQPNTARAGVSGINVVRPPTNASVRRVYRRPVAQGLSNNSARGLKGAEFEKYLNRRIGGNGSFKVSGREFDGRVGNRWWEAKSGQYWEKIQNNSQELVKFKSDMGQRASIARQNGATYELFSNTPIPQHIKEWLTKKGIPFTEILN